MSRTIYLGAVYEPGMRHTLSFDAYGVGKNVRAETPNISSVTIEYYDCEGRLLARQYPAYLAPVVELDASFEERALIMLRIEYEVVLPANIYAYLLSSAGDQATTYAVGAAVGYPDLKTWLNRVSVALTAPPAGWRHEMFVANPSRWSNLQYRMRLYRGRESKYVEGILRPKAHHLISLEQKAEELGLTDAPDAVALISRNKSINYMIGRENKTGSVSFVEHLVSQARASGSIAPPPKWNEIAGGENDNLLKSVFCFCNGMTLEEALKTESAGHVGRYCTGCRDDLQKVRKLLVNDRSLAQDAKGLSQLLSSAND